MKASSVAVLVGEDDFQKRLVLEDLKLQIFPSGSNGFNDDRFDAKERSVSEILDLCNTLPMFAERRMVCVRNWEAGNEAEQAKWMSYFESPAPSTLLILTAQKLDRRTKVSKTLERSGYIHELAPPDRSELPRWVARIAKNHAVEVTTKASEALAGACGSNLGLMDQSLEKLKLYVYPKTTVDEDAVSSIVGRSAESNLFAWTDQVVEGDVRPALLTLGDLLDHGNQPLVLLSLLARHIRILIQSKELSLKNVASREYASRLGIPPFTVRKYNSQASLYTRETLLTLLSELAKLDRELKSTTLSARVLLEQTIFRFSGARNPKLQSRHFS